MTFDDLAFEPHPNMDGIQARHEFSNGYGVSVIKGSFSYGGGDGLYELAVTADGGKLCYDTPITDDVLGSLTPDEVTEVMCRVAVLAPADA